MRVLVIDDDAEALDLVSTCLWVEGFEVRTVSSGVEGLQVARRWMPDLVLLDMRLPDVGGLELCRQLRAFSDVPILLMSAYATDLKDQIRGLDIGADDYLVKPLDFDLLRARVRALLRRSAKAEWRAERPAYVDPRLIVDLSRQQVFVEGQPVSLSDLEYRILAVLVRNAGQAVPMAEIVEEVWPGQERESYPHVVRQYVKRLRERIEPDPQQPRYLVTEWGFGYKFDPQ